jgi:putative membrane protein insertion efficiency factor
MNPSLGHWPRRALIGLVRAYRFFLSPWLGSSCRFEPTCSAYALQALDRHGALGGSYLTLRRIGRCHPWCDGGCDPVPDTLPRPFPSRAGGARATGGAQPSPTDSPIA